MEPKFDPSEYKSIAEMPENEQGNFTPIEKKGKSEAGFVGSDAFEHAENAGEDATLRNKRRGILQKLFNVNEVSELDVLHEEAVSEDISREDAKQEERRKKESEEHEIARQAKVEEERILEEKWKNSEEFKKHSLFKDFWETGPDFRKEVLPVLWKFAEDANTERSENSYKLFHEVRKLIYENLVSGDVAKNHNQALDSSWIFDMPSDWKSIEDDKRFLESTADLAPGEPITIGPIITHAYFNSERKQTKQINWSLFFAALSKHLDDPQRFILSYRSESEAAGVINTHARDIYDEDDEFNLSKYSPVPRLDGIKEVALKRVALLEEKRQEAMAMNKDQYAAFLENERITKLEDKKKKELEHIANEAAREAARQEAEKKEAERIATQKELKEKLLG